jgi:uncharacterized membrane protein YeaQ/YmgE (transglycosylase-associated protein family)
MRLDPTTTFIAVLVIGILVGILVDRLLGRRGIVGRFTGGGMVTPALVGVAGAFIGFHLAELLRLGSGSMRLVAAAVGALVVAWAWRFAR